MLCKKLHHAAFRCRDARETVDFYTRVLGLRFTHAMGEDHVPSTGFGVFDVEYRPNDEIVEFTIRRSPGGRSSSVRGCR